MPPLITSLARDRFVLLSRRVACPHSPVSRPCSGPLRSQRSQRPGWATPVSAIQNRRPDTAEQSRHFASTRAYGDAQPLHDDYYAELLSQPLPVSTATRRPSGNPPSAAAATESTPDHPAEQTPAERARIIFGSRLLSPAMHKENMDDVRNRGEGEWIAGRWVPPRPSEPENCCMSGCVNCVWDMYREDLEEWVATRSAAKAEDRRRRQARVNQQMLTSIQGDEDGLGSSNSLGGLRSGDDESVETLMRDIPVGIREFMKTEKMLQKRHRQSADG